jgi:heme exporter protein D
MMHWHSWSEFVRMGGYGLHVWDSYLVTLVLLGFEAAQVARRRRQAVDGARCRSDA